MAILYVFFLYYMLIIFICNLKSICEIKICGFKLNFGIILVCQFEILWFFSVAKFAKLKTHKIINKVIDSTDLTTVGNPWKKLLMDCISTSLKITN